ncbi:hypothetical protein QUA35_02285, partial [Microcoleus sp. N9_B2]|uniref:hypothetical protein n=1 Tax=unclassified Microcoleus TaxID=2642155 RepID=UPI002FD20B68
GRMPNPYSPQYNLSLVEQASCLFSIINVNQPFMGGQDAQPLLPTIQFISCGTGILPVLDRGTKCQLK